MKNITVSVPDEVYRQARIPAAERDTSESALVREYLSSLYEMESEFDRLERLQEEVLATVKHVSASDRLSRDEVHDRCVLR